MADIVKHTVRSRPGRILELDGVRAVAIALVIGCHYPAFASSLWRIPEFGWVGVEIFFVLSGYLITTNLFALRGRRNAYRAFYARRARRILPPYLLTIGGCISVCGIAYVVARGKVPLGNALRTILMDLFFLQSLVPTVSIFSHVFTAVRTGQLPSLIHPGGVPWISRPGESSLSLTTALGPAWSLSVEEWFYILWAPLVLIFRRYGIITALALSSLLGFILRWLGPTAPGFWYVDFFCRFDTLALGAALAVWLQPRILIRPAAPTKGEYSLWCAGTLSLGLLSVLLFSMRPVLGHQIRDSAMFAAFGTPLIGMTVAAAIAWIIRNHGRNNYALGILRSRVLVYIGRRSYTIYLVHLPWYWVVSAFFGGTYLAPRQQWVVATISLSLTVVTAAVSWNLIEAPLLGISKQEETKACLAPAAEAPLVTA